METLVELIAKKRDGERLSDAQIERLIRASRRRRARRLPDERAGCMAVFFRGMDDAETVALTRAMLHSGDVLDLLERPGRQGGQALHRRRRRQGLALPRARWSPRAACACRWSPAGASATPAARSTSSRRSRAST